ncbi:protein FAM151B isoform X2 [Octodon degus]|uniref:Protein FAM151B isoform X2 n=1 Tax=Octodon degus TaxID=10160 RepID=A0A6P6D9J3_OCTDE|nr:protein FAM151B isoform X2 [Octodon degus]
MAAPAAGPGCWSENILDYFLRTHQIATEDGAEISWYHGANRRAQTEAALRSAAHMVEADVLLPSAGAGAVPSQPVMAHPPETHSDNTLQAWLAALLPSTKGIKLDFKSGSSNVVDAKPFIDTVTSFFPAVTLSLGWTTGWHPEKANEGYSWEMVREMESICSGLSQPVTFPVRAVLVRQSCPQLLWLLKRSDRYSLTVWTAKDDSCSTEDLLYIRDCFDKKKVFYDILEPQNREFKQAIGITANL